MAKKKKATAENKSNPLGIEGFESVPFDGFIRGNERKIRFSVVKKNALYGISLNGKDLLNDASGKKALLYRDETTVKYVATKLNGAKGQLFEGNTLSSTPCHAYYLLSNHVIHGFDVAGKVFWRGFVKDSIQRDNTFRIDATPDFGLEQLSANEPVYRFLEKKLIVFSPKTPNYAASLKELKERNIERVAKNILEAVLLNQLVASPPMTRTVAFYMTNQFESVALALTLISGEMNKDQFSHAYLVAKESEYGQLIPQSEGKRIRKRVTSALADILDYLSEAK